jgi:uncharacterized Zn finger protein
MSWYNAYPKYVSVAERKAKIEKQLKKLKKDKNKFEPVVIAGRSIAKTFWGTAWCDNIESYRDYAYRLERGRSYVRHGAVIDLKINAGNVNALVCGSRNYTVKITVAPAPSEQWKLLLKQCAGKINSLIELLQGKISKSIMEIIAKNENGLFPTNNEIKFSCSCPDSAIVCKHVSAVLYGIGARLDTEPEKLFLLRSVDHTELFMHAVQNNNLATQTAQSSPLDGDLSQIFGIEISTQEQKKAKSPKIIPAKVDAAEKTKIKKTAIKPEPKPKPKKKTTKKKSTTKKNVTTQKSPATKKKTTTTKKKALSKKKRTA